MQQFLEKMRSLTQLWQESAQIDFSDLIKALSESINAKIYVFDLYGSIEASSSIKHYENDSKLLEDKLIIERCMAHLTKSSKDRQWKTTEARKTTANIRMAFGHNNSNDFAVITIVPIYAKEKYSGTLLAIKYNDNFLEQEVALSEYTANIIGMEKFKDNITAEELSGNKSIITALTTTLTYSEYEAMASVLGELHNCEGLVVLAKISQNIGIARSVVVTALKKISATGLIESKSLGVKGTYIKVKDKSLIEMLNKEKK